MRPPERSTAERLAPRGEVLDSSVMENASAQLERVRQHYLFAGLSPADYDRLAPEITLSKLDKGEVLFHRGDPAEHFFFLDAGLIELSLISPAGEKKILEVLGPGRTFAEAVAFMRETRYPVTAEALEKSHLCQVPNAAYERILRSDSDACLRLLSDISRHLHARVREIERLTVQNSRSRLASYLLDHVIETNDDEATVRLELPRHVIAARLSIQPETLSRLLRVLTDDGIITVEDRIIFVHSLARLRPYD